MAAKAKKSKAVCQDGFALPDSLNCSVIELPIFERTQRKANWHKILEESNVGMKEIEEYEKRKTKADLKAPFQKAVCDYIQNEVFDCLLPALEDTLNKAKMWNALHHPNCFFNGIDWIVQEIWNNNPRHPSRKYDHKHVFNIPWVRKYLVKNPRPLYPKSWLWPEKYAVTVIQKSVRQYFVQRETEVQEMRDFWRKLEIERNNSLLELNPMLAKEFASAPVLHGDNNNTTDIV